MQKASVCSPDLSAALDQAFNRARAELHAAEAAADGLASAAAERDTDEHSDRLLLGRELLLAVREPLEWLLALARRLAAGDPDDVAAIDRLTAAFHSRLACGGLGVSMADALTAFGILIGALDPAVVLHAATRTISDGVVTILAFEGATLTAQLGRIADALPAAVRRVCVPRARPHLRHTF